MQINRSTTSAVRTAYKVQNVAGPDLSVAQNLPIAKPQPELSQAAKDQTAAVGGTMAVGGLLAAAVGALAFPPLGFAGLAVAAVGGIGWLMNQGGKQPELAKPADTPAPKPVTAQPAPLDGPGRRRLERIFAELDEDGNGRLEGDELKDNTLFNFDPDADEGMTREDFVSEAATLDGMAGVRVADVRAASLKAKIFQLMTEVWGTDAYCNNTSFTWWKGQLKTVDGDMDRLRDIMTAYKANIEVR